MSASVPTVAGIKINVCVRTYCGGYLLNVCVRIYCAGYLLNVCVRTYCDGVFTKCLLPTMAGIYYMSVSTLGGIYQISDTLGQRTDINKYLPAWLSFIWRVRPGRHSVRYLLNTSDLLDGPIFASSFFAEAFDVLVSSPLCYMAKCYYLFRSRTHNIYV